MAHFKLTDFFGGMFCFTSSYTRKAQFQRKSPSTQIGVFPDIHNCRVEEQSWGNYATKRDPDVPFNVILVDSVVCRAPGDHSSHHITERKSAAETIETGGKRLPPVLGYDIDVGGRVFYVAVARPNLASSCYMILVSSLVMTNPPANRPTGIGDKLVFQVCALKSYVKIRSSLSGRVPTTLHFPSPMNTRPSEGLRIIFCLWHYQGISGSSLVVSVFPSKNSVVFNQTPPFEPPGKRNCSLSTK